jgi:hypothetical protein
MDFDFENESANMIRHYIRRGYPQKLLTKHRDKGPTPHGQRQTNN